MAVSRERIITAFVLGAGSAEDADLMAGEMGLTLTQLVDAVTEYREAMAFDAELAQSLAGLDEYL